MCCRCPPFPGIPVYLVLNIIFGIFAFLSDGFYIAGPAEIQIISIDACPGFEDDDIRLQLEVDGSLQTINGNVSLNEDFDETVKVNLRDIVHSKYQKYPGRSFINQTSLCKLVDNYKGSYDIDSSDESESLDSICPISKGTYAVESATAKFTVISLPYEMMGRKKYQMELIRNGKLLVCRRFDVRSSLKPVNQFADM